MASIRHSPRSACRLFLLLTSNCFPNSSLRSMFRCSVHRYQPLSCAGVPNL
ncbi:hypothetical protein PR003_g23299 [Phytophthora rubi]|uniref:Uncharacterized protein n=1 Tax=Phytophthora rubi TaxID=129364 RepID=A0A6A4D862_9STRA|nr:hypothetical protein PR002_g15610 [Phytophthora rubi]KAE9014836.1 hypothetical protein PR001_g15039 [Phytophthora rubi]KAE9298226.1 hypothetical protein PR003_g23299 [Phytophthora rubi]